MTHKQRLVAICYLHAKAIQRNRLKALLRTIPVYLFLLLMLIVSGAASFTLVGSFLYFGLLAIGITSLTFGFSDLLRATLLKARIEAKCAELGVNVGDLQSVTSGEREKTGIFNA